RAARRRAGARAPRRRRGDRRAGRARRRYALRARAAPERLRRLDVSGRLIGWLTLVAALAAANYGSRSAAGSPSRNALYHYSTAVGGLVQYAIILAVVVWIAGGSRELLALVRPRSWPRALGAGVGAIVFVYVIGA